MALLSFTCSASLSKYFSTIGVGGDGDGGGGDGVGGVGVGDVGDDVGDGVSGVGDGGVWFVRKY